MDQAGSSPTRSPTSYRSDNGGTSAARGSPRASSESRTARSAIAAHTASRASTPTVGQATMLRMKPIRERPSMRISPKIVTGEM